MKQAMLLICIVLRQQPIEDAHCRVLLTRLPEAVVSPPKRLEKAVERNRSRGRPLGRAQFPF
jgi:hypothetical protein